MTESHSQNSASNSTVKRLRIAQHGTILTLRIIPNRKLHTISFQMAYNLAMYTVGTLNSSKTRFWSLAARLFY